jgi:hypothetical protein
MKENDIDNLDYDAMEPVENSRAEDAHYLNHLVPIKQIVVRKQPAQMIFQTGIQKNKQVSYDDILASMNLYVKDGKLHKIDTSNGIKMTPPPKPKAPLTPEEIQTIQQQRRHALHLNYIQQQRLHAQIKETKSKQIKFINNTSYLELDSHTTMHAFKLIGK